MNIKKIILSITLGIFATSLLAQPSQACCNCHNGYHKTKTKVIYVNDYKRPHKEYRKHKRKNTRYLIVKPNDYDRYNRYFYTNKFFEPSNAYIRIGFN